MQVTSVKVIHSEARVTSDAGEFKQYTVGYEADLDEGETDRGCRRELMERAIRAVRLLHGDTIEGVKLTIETIPKTRSF